MSRAEESKRLKDGVKSLTAKPNKSTRSAQVVSSSRSTHRNGQREGIYISCTHSPQSSDSTKISNRAQHCSEVNAAAYKRRNIHASGGRGGRNGPWRRTRPVWSSPRCLPL